MNQSKTRSNASNSSRVSKNLADNPLGENLVEKLFAKSRHQQRQKGRTAALFVRAVQSLDEKQQESLLHVICDLKIVDDLSLAKHVDISTKQAGPDLSLIPASVDRLDSERSTNESVQSNSPYGKAQYKYSKICKLNDILIQIGAKLLRVMNDKSFPYNLKLRGEEVLLGPSMIQERIATLCDIKLSSKEIAVIMKRFDHKKQGLADIKEILAFARDEYKNNKHMRFMERQNKKKDEEMKANLELRYAFCKAREDKILEKDLSYSINVKMAGTVLSDSSFERKLRTSHVNRLSLSPKEFQVLLVELGMNLSKREEHFLEKEYMNTTTLMIDWPTFRTHALIVVSKSLNYVSSGDLASSAFLKIEDDKGATAAVDAPPLTGHLAEYFYKANQQHQQHHHHQQQQQQQAPDLMFGTSSLRGWNGAESVLMAASKSHGFSPLQSPLGISVRPTSMSMSAPQSCGHLRTSNTPGLTMSPSLSSRSQQLQFIAQTYAEEGGAVRVASSLQPGPPIAVGEEGFSVEREGSVLGRGSVEREGSVPGGGTSSSSFKLLKVKDTKGVSSMISLDPLFDGSHKLKANLSTQTGPHTSAASMQDINEQIQTTGRANTQIAPMSKSTLDRQSKSLVSNFDPLLNGMALMPNVHKLKALSVSAPQPSLLPSISPCDYQSHGSRERMSVAHLQLGSNQRPASSSSIGNGRNGETLMESSDWEGGARSRTPTQGSEGGGSSFGSAIRSSPSGAISRRSPFNFENVQGGEFGELDMKLLPLTHQQLLQQQLQQQQHQQQQQQYRALSRQLSRSSLRAAALESVEESNESDDKG